MEDMNQAHPRGLARGVSRCLEPPPPPQGLSHAGGGFPFPRNPPRRRIM